MWQWQPLPASSPACPGVWAPLAHPEPYQLALGPSCRQWGLCRNWDTAWGPHGGCEGH